MSEKKKKKPYVSPYERKFGKKHPNNPKARDGTTGIGPVAPDHPKFEQYESHLKSREEGVKSAKKADAKSDGKGYKIAGAVADAVGDFAGQMSAAHKESWKGVNPRATKVRGGKGSTYNYQPKKMTDKPGDTSPMIRYDSDYEKKKKNLGL